MSEYYEKDTWKPPETTPPRRIYCMACGKEILHNTSTCADPPDTRPGIPYFVDKIGPLCLFCAVLLYESNVKNAGTARKNTGNTRKNTGTTRNPNNAG
jgi:hypothetical protein